MRISDWSSTCALPICRLSYEKAAAVASRQPDALIRPGATVVAAGRRIRPKAEGEAQARFCLQLLAGRRHRVHSAGTLIDAEGRAHNRLSTSIVTFKRLHPDEIEAYIRSGEWQGKAGGYAIQGCAAGLIRSMSGNYSGVVGLPLFDVRRSEEHTSELQTLMRHPYAVFCLRKKQ